MKELDYYGTYARFETSSKKEAAALLGADNLVGDIYTITFLHEKENKKAWIKNRFGNLVGFLDEKLTRQLSLYEAREWVLCALLSFVAYSEEPAPGHYWGEIALVCYNPRYEKAFYSFTRTLSARMAEGMRPDISLGAQGVQQVIESDGTWSPKKYEPLPSKTSSTAFLKTRQSLSDKMVEQARKRNKGCYGASLLILFLIIGALFLILKECSGLFA